MRVLVLVDQPRGYRSLKASYPMDLQHFTEVGKYSDWVGPFVDTEPNGKSAR